MTQSRLRAIALAGTLVLAAWTGGGVELSPFTIVEGDRLAASS